MRPGYKLTEVGVIPVEWETSGLLSTVSVANGQVDPSKEPFRSMVLVAPDHIEPGTGKLLAKRTAAEQGAISGKYTFCPGDIVYSKIRPYLKKAIRADFAGLCSADMYPLRPVDGVDGGYILSVLLAYRFTKYAESVSVRSGMPKINRAELADFAVAVPPFPEQRAISAALSDVDALLGGLDRLIAKKRDLKQAAMQQLLTGMTRLPGFHGEWEVKRLKDVAEISTGINKPLSEMGSGALYVTVQDLYDGTSIRTDRLSRIKVSRSEVDTRSLAIGDIVFGKSSVKRDGIGYPSQFRGCGEPVVFSGFSYRARARRGVADATFLLYGLRAQRTRRWLIDNSQASALTNINQTISDAIPIRFPPTVPEQIAIAAVLSDMDAELSALEARRDKTCALKQGMMQELLTGRTRLV